MRTMFVINSFVGSSIFNIISFLTFNDTNNLYSLNDKQINKCLKNLNKLDKQQFHYFGQY